MKNDEERLLYALQYAQAWLTTDTVTARVVDASLGANHPVAPLAELEDMTPDGDLGQITQAQVQSWLRSHRPPSMNGRSMRYLVRWKDHYTALVVPGDRLSAPVFFDPHAKGWLRYADPLRMIRAVFGNVQPAVVSGQQPFQRAPHDTFCGTWSVRFLAGRHAPTGLVGVLRFLCQQTLALLPDFQAYLRDDLSLPAGESLALVRRLKRFSTSTDPQTEYTTAFYAPFPGVDPTGIDADGRRCVVRGTDRCAMRRALPQSPGFGGRECPRRRALERLDCLVSACRAQIADAGARWVLDGQAIDPAARAVEWVALVDALDARVREAFPGLAATATIPAGDRTWGCRGRTTCQYRRYGPGVSRPWPPCPVPQRRGRLSCAQGALRLALRELNKVRHAPRVPRGVATFRARLAALRADLTRI